MGGTIEDTELVEGLALNQSVIASAGGPTRVEKAKIGLIQFQLSSPKPDVGGVPSYLSRADNADGQPDRRERLPTDGQDPQGGATIFAQSVQTDQEDGLQRASYSEINSSRRRDRPLPALLVQAQDHGHQGY